MQLWKPDCHRRAVGSVMKAKARGDQELTLHQKLHAVEQARQKNMDAGERDWGDSWRPVTWLTWVIAGSPAARARGSLWTPSESGALGPPRRPRRP
jgi:hypothetical protein